MSLGYPYEAYEAYYHAWPVVGAPLGYTPFVPARSPSTSALAFAETNGNGNGQNQNRASSWRAALRAVTPTLFVVGLVSGIAFGLGGGLVNRYVWGRR